MTHPAAGILARALARNSSVPKSQGRNDVALDSVEDEEVKVSAEEDVTNHDDVLDSTNLGTADTDNEIKEAKEDAKDGNDVSLDDTSKSEDAVEAPEAVAVESIDTASRDAYLDSVSNGVKSEVKLLAVSALKEWVETDDLDEDETLAERLKMLIVAVADEDKDGEITRDEQDVMDIAIDAMVDYCLGKGLPESDLEGLFSDWDNDCAKTVSDALIDSMPEGDEATLDDVDNFVFDGIHVHDDVALDAVYKKKVVIRNGKKVKIKKRISGRVKLSPKQKKALSKARRFSNNATAKRKRMKSNKIREKMGM